MVIKKVGVIGCGLMGHGIAQVAAQAGFEVIVRESAQEPLDKGLGRIGKSLNKLVEKEKSLRRRPRTPIRPSMMSTCPSKKCVATVVRRLHHLRRLRHLRGFIIDGPWWFG